MERLVPADFRVIITQPVRRLYTSVFLVCTGLGFTLSMLVVYLHNVRGYSTSFAAGILAGTSLIGVLLTPVWGTMIDRFGPWIVNITSMTANSVALVAWAFSRSTPAILASAAALACVGGGSWGPNAVLLSRLVPSEHRQRAFGLNFMIVNLAIGFGALASAALVDLRHPASFTMLYLLNAGTIMAAALTYVRLRPWGGPVTEHLDDEVKASEGWDVVLADRRFLRYIFASLILSLGGYAALDSGFSLFAVNNLHVSVHAIGLIFFFNTSTIVVLQFWVVNKIQGRSRARVLGLVGGLWVIYWLVLAGSLALTPVTAVAALSVATVIFAVGEMLLQPVSSALVNDMAPEHLRGRYNSAAGTTWGMAGSIAPLVTSLYFTSGAGNWWPLGTAVTAAVACALMLDLRHRLSPAEDGREKALAVETEN